MRRSEGESLACASTNCRPAAPRQLGADQFEGTVLILYRFAARCTSFWAFSLHTRGAEPEIERRHYLVAVFKRAERIRFSLDAHPLLMYIVSVSTGLMMERITSARISRSNLSSAFSCREESYPREAFRRGQSKLAVLGILVQKGGCLTPGQLNRQQCRTHGWKRNGLGDRPSNQHLHSEERPRSQRNRYD